MSETPEVPLSLANDLHPVTSEQVEKILKEVKQLINSPFEIKKFEMEASSNSDYYFPDEVLKK